MRYYNFFTTGEEYFNKQEYVKALKYFNNLYYDILLNNKKYYYIYLDISNNYKNTVYIVLIIIAKSTIKIC